MMKINRITQAAQRIAVLKGRFIHHERYTPLAASFEMLVEMRLADLSAGMVNEAHGLALAGPSGAGKSAAIEFLLDGQIRRLADEGYGKTTIISLRVPSPATLKFLGQTLLRALGYQISSERQAWYIWDLVRHHLKERRVLFVHLDEAQDLASRGTKHELNAVASMLKTLMTDKDWPVGIILSGTNELEDILNHDPQLARRMKTTRFESLSPAAHGEDVVDLLESFCERAQLDPEEDVLELTHGERLVHAAANQFGLVIELILAAIEDALLQEQKTLNRNNFVRAYHLRTSCDPEFNPFVVPDFLRVDARQVFTRENRT
ncbi:TniB family NTP-binding protein [Phaeobacter inhibens]|uniref:TniB family NTP-binding protein n=1 Tax=Phaeobacter inhibens TaxID=221822 RepID=UPI0021A6E22D|nr:TniB family NTP-binding protein [Phaeobacter inhibens]UWR99685.1 TniB family NTP-binding protein [Phaeobacter inhibens]